MKAFLAWFNGESDRSIRCSRPAIAHLWFVTIHPFDDGNGRIARAIADMQLARSEESPQRFYSMSAQIRQERNAYYDILEATQKGDLDITPWLRMVSRRVWIARSTARKTILAGVSRRRRGFGKSMRARRSTTRQRDMLNRLLDGFEGKLTSSKWATIEKCSPDTALRDISDLVERGILQQGRRRRAEHELFAGFKGLSPGVAPTLPPRNRPPAWARSASLQWRRRSATRCSLHRQAAARAADVGRAREKGAGVGSLALLRPPARATCALSLSPRCGETFSTSWLLPYRRERNELSATDA